jgi:beta-galactosidase
MKFGVCYYPEHWPETRWAHDARMMRAAGLDHVRLAEFAWARMEPSPGHYDWSWLDRAIETLAAVGLHIILGTPTATPPAWLTHAIPDIRRMDANGMRRDHGARRHYCPNHPAWRDHSRRIVQQMAARYGNDPRVTGWQIDNEFGGGKSARCYCDECAAAFRRWLHTRYGSLEALNEGWGTVFWSQQYDSWEQIVLPGDSINYKNPGHLLDFYRFSSDSYVTYQREQVEILRRLAPGRFITHNFMGLYRDLDQFDLARDLDYVTWDNYPTGNPDRWRQRLYPPGSDWSRTDPVYAPDVGDPIITGMAHALTFALKEAPFGVMEQQAGYINWGEVNPWVRPGTPRLWAWHAIGAGANAITWFRWRATILAQEQYHSGLLRHDGEPDVGYGEQLRLAQEQGVLARIGEAPLSADIALLFDFDDLWSLEINPHRRDFDYLRHLFAFWHALQRLGLSARLVSRDSDLRPYRLVIAPSLHLADERDSDRLHAFVAEGGTLLLGVRSGFKQPDSLVTDQPLPGALRSLVGATVTSWRSLPEGMAQPFETAIPGLVGPAGYWVETLEPESAETLVKSADSSAALLTRRRLGDGQTLYLGFWPRPDQAQALLAHLAHELALPRIAGLPPGMLAARRGADTLLLNFTDHPLDLTLHGQTHTVPARDVRVVGNA